MDFISPNVVLYWITTPVLNMWVLSKRKALQAAKTVESPCSNAESLPATLQWAYQIDADCFIEPFGGFHKLRYPQHGWFVRGNPIRIDDVGLPPFQETSICGPFRAFFNTLETTALVVSVQCELSIPVERWFSDGNVVSPFWGGYHTWLAFLWSIAIACLTPLGNTWSFLKKWLDRSVHRIPPIPSILYEAWSANGVTIIYHSLIAINPKSGKKFFRMVIRWCFPYTC